MCKLIFFVFNKIVWNTICYTYSIKESSVSLLHGLHGQKPELEFRQGQKQSLINYY